MISSKDFNKYFHLFAKDNQNYLYGNMVNKIVSINTDEYEIICHYVKGKNHIEIDDLLNLENGTAKTFIEELSSIIIPKSLKYTDNKLPELEAITLIVDEGCNFACKYCYGEYALKDGKMSRETVHKCIDLAMLYNIPYISFFGGEPLLNVDIIKEAISYSKLKKYKGQFSMTTNGSLIDEEMALYFHENNVRVSVSMDGSKLQHDKTRVYKDGSSTFKDVKKGIDNLKKYNLLSMLEVTYSAEHDDNLQEQIKDATKLHNIVSCACVDGKPNSNHDKHIVKGEKLINYYEQLLELELHNNLENTDIVGVKELYNKIGKGPLLQTPYLCTDIGRRIIIDFDGKAYPCPEMIDAKYCIGNINQERFFETLDERRQTILHKLSSNNIKHEWFSYMCETCIQHVEEDKDGVFRYYNSEDFSNAIEVLLKKYIDMNRV